MSLDALRAKLAATAALRPSGRVLAVTGLSLRFSMPGVRVGDVVIVKRKGELVTLTRTEWMLLQHLAANAGRIMLNAELLSKVWGPEYRDDLQYLRVWVSRLRRKLEEEPSQPRLIKTFQGIGYMFDLGLEEGESEPVEEEEEVDIGVEA